MQIWQRHRGEPCGDYSLELLAEEQKRRRAGGNLPSKNDPKEFLNEREDSIDNPVAQPLQSKGKIRENTVRFAKILALTENILALHAHTCVSSFVPTDSIALKDSKLG